MNFDDVAHWALVFKEILTGVAAVVAVIIAAMGLHTWKRQLFGNTNYEQSRRLLRATYRLRDAIGHVRAPFMTVGERVAAKQATGVSEDEEAVYKVRWQKIMDARVEFDAELLEAEALWGPQIRGRADVLLRCIGELGMALRRWLSRRDGYDDEKISGTIYGDDSVPSEYSTRLRGAIKGIEEEIRPHLKL